MKFSPLFLFIFLLIPCFFAPLASGQKNKTDARRLFHPPIFASQKISLNGLKIHFVELGEGPPLLFLHGLGGSFKDWAPSLQFFSPSYRASAIDFPGFGDSDKPEVEYSIEWLTKVVENFLRERKIDRVNLVGHSMGALVALNLAAQPDSPVKKLAVCDAVGIGDKAGFLSYALTKKIMGPESRFETLEGILRDEFKSMIDDFFKGQKPKTAREFFESLPKTPFTGKPLLPMTPSVQMSASIIDFDIRPKPSAVKQPTLIIWGAKDPIAPLPDASFLQGRIPQSTLKILEGCGHSPMLEQPVRFNQEVSKFLQAAESGSSR